MREKTARSQAEAQNAAKDQFLAMLGHELRNPLAPISAAAELLNIAALDETRVKLASAIITRQTSHLTDLVDDLLDVSRVTRGLISLDKQALDIKRIVTDAVEQVRPLIDARRHHLAVHLPAEPAFVLGDQKRLIQVLTNLLNNAAKYTSEGGNIVLRMELQAEQIMIAVADNGIGMAPELLGRAFELFAQAERSSDRAQGGLGLGLALVKSLTELHGGHVSAQSRGIGEGSEFTVFLPRIASSPEPSMTKHDDPPYAFNNRLRLLIVDDNADAAGTLAMFLEAIGHDIIVEHESRRALERARIERPDACLLDIGLPDMDGIELARRLRSQPQTAEVILIAITGYGQRQDRENAIAAGFDYHFVKPVDTEKLASLLARFAGRPGNAA
jgi:CheY-like chemotaxis protein